MQSVTPSAPHLTADILLLPILNQSNIVLYHSRLSHTEPQFLLLHPIIGFFSGYKNTTQLLQTFSVFLNAIFSSKLMLLGKPFLTNKSMIFRRHVKFKMTRSCYYRWCQTRLVTLFMCNCSISFFLGF